MENTISTLGNSFVTKNGEANDASLKSAKVIGIYFSAHWCPPCRGFTPELAELYNKINANEKILEIVFVTSDRDEKSFKEYLSEMPWLALPFGASNIQSLKTKYAVRSIPTLVIIKPDGETVTASGRDDVYNLGEDCVKTWISKF